MSQIVVYIVFETIILDKSLNEYMSTILIGWVSVLHERKLFYEGNTFAQRLICTSVIYARGGTFARHLISMEGHFCTKENFCTATILYKRFMHERTLLQGEILQNVTFAEVVFLQKCLCTTKVLKNRFILNVASLLHASNYLLFKKN